MSQGLWSKRLALTLGIILLTTPAFAEISFKWGPYFRIRHEFMKNNSDMQNDRSNYLSTATGKDNRNYFRFKTSLWGQATYNKNITVYAKLTNENRAYTYWAPSTSKPTGKTDKYQHYDINETFFDSLYLDIKDTLGYPIDLRIGRQDFGQQYGEGFLIQEGTPGDGSRAQYFNAFKASARLAYKNKLDLLLIKQNRTDDFLPIINRFDGNTTLSTTNENAVALIHQNDNIPNWHFEDYYIYKGENGEGFGKFNTYKNKLNTLGGYVKWVLNTWTFKAQLANQWGTYGNYKRTAVGGYGVVNKSFDKVLLAPKVSLGYLYLSGDKTSSTDNEAWDPLFSRWTTFSDFASDILPNLYGVESGTAYWTNLKLYRIGLNLGLTKKMKLGLAYNWVDAPEAVTATTTLFGTGHKRGDLYCAKLDYAFNKNVTGYISGEYFDPGSFYVINTDAAIFTRANLEIKF